jgi:DNA-binding CsgD family transcriptional regulator
MSCERLIDQIYEAAADPSLWPQVMHDLAGSVDAAGGIILTRRADAWLGWRYSVAMEPGAEAYMRAGAIRSQATARLLGVDHAGFVTEAELFAEEDYLTDPIMTEWSAPAGLLHAAATAIHAPSGDLVVVQINRRTGQPQFGHGEIARLDAIRPHLARAGLLAARWRLERLRAAAEALALLGLPAVILDARGKALAANSLIEEMKSHLIWLPKDRIALTDSNADTLLRRSIGAISDPAAISARSFPAKGRTGRTVIVHLIPATGGARDLFEGGFAVLALTPVAAPCAPDAALIRGLFDLTAAEARVASGVAEGLSPEQIAERHGATRDTVRHQLKTVFSKIGVTRQSQLAALFWPRSRGCLS